jgi:hypothetical protein
MGEDGRKVELDAEASAALARLARATGVDDATALRDLLRAAAGGPPVSEESEAVRWARIDAALAAVHADLRARGIATDSRAALDGLYDESGLPR